MKVAIIHDWLTGMRGGERCLEVFAELFPRAHLFTLVHKKGSVSKTIESLKIHTSFLNSIPGIADSYRNYLPFFPAAMQGFNLREFDLVLSSSHCVANGVAKADGALQLSYCYTPMRYLYDFYDLYFDMDRIGPVKRALMDSFRDDLQAWDLSVSNRVHGFIAISNYIRERIRRIYHRESTVIYPPVDCSRFALRPDPENYYLMVTALVPYKRVDLAIQAFNKLGKSLLIIGSGPEEARLKALAGRNIEFLGWQSDNDVAYHYSRCRALVFPQEEDFGITPLEAQASGRPVIAYGKGGALETIVPLGREEPTGIFFHDQTPDALISAVREFERKLEAFTSKACRDNARRFDLRLFRTRIQDYVMSKYEEWAGH